MSDAVAPALRANQLGYAEVLAQSVSVIAPSTVPAAVLGLIYASAGNGTWLSFLLGMLGLIFVSLNIIQFARLSASSGSLYSYIVKGLGPTVGVLGGSALLFAYVLTGMSTLCGFVITVNGVLSLAGFTLPPIILLAVAAGLSFMLASRDVQLSSKAMLVFEGASVTTILLLGAIVWEHKGFALDHAQVTLSHVTPGGVLMGMVLVIFGFSGFESSTALGEEAKDPLRTIPRSMKQSVVVSGIIFIFMAYVVILGFRGLPVDLANQGSPLLTLSDRLGLNWLGIFINIGIALSFFSCTLASISATSRIIFSMARNGLVPRALGNAHRRNKTPHVAIGFTALLMFAATAVLPLIGISDYNGQGYFGTLCSFGFLVVYILISLAAPVFLRKRRRLTKRAVVIATVSAIFMVIPFLGMTGVPGSRLFPAPAYPNNLLIFVFLAYMAGSAIWLASRRKRDPRVLDNIFDFHNGSTVP